MNEIKNRTEEIPDRYSKFNPKFASPPIVKQSGGFSPAHPTKSGNESLEESPVNSRNLSRKQTGDLKLHQASIHTIKEFDHEGGDALGATEPSQSGLNPPKDTELVGSQVLFSSDPLPMSENEATAAMVVKDVQEALSSEDIEEDGSPERNHQNNDAD